MADNEQIDQSEEKAVVETDSVDTSTLGVYTDWDYSPEPFANLSADAKAALLNIDNITDKTDSSARRLEVEQAWEAIHFDRGYQFLYKNRRGGWDLPGQGLGNGKKAPDSGNLITTDVYSGTGQKITGALVLEVPRVEFFPRNPNYAPDITASQVADDFKDIWFVNNDLKALMKQCASIFWNEDRAVFYTRYVLDGQKYGFEDDSVPLVPEDEDAPPTDDPTGQLGLDEVEEENQSPEKTGRKPRGQEVTSVFGKLDVKVPIAVDEQGQMHFIKLFRDMDVSIAKAKFPWISKKINPGSAGASDSELDRIARENTRQAVGGSYVTGDSLGRHVVIKYAWYRPSAFSDDSVTDLVRTELLEAFPDGCLLVKAGTEYAFSRNESMDEHLHVSHAIPGKGQNRKALGSAAIPIQKRINDWVNLIDSFFRRTVPKKWYSTDAFDIEALRNQVNTPGSSGPFTPQPGMTSVDQYIMVEPTPQPQAALSQFIEYFSEKMMQEVTGAVPSLYGAATNTETVGGIEIQRDQALQRLGPVWSSLCLAVAAAAKQAVICAARCREESISQAIPGRGTITVDPSDLKGSIECYPEVNAAFPESWAQRERKLMTLIDGAKGNPEFQKTLFTSKNLPVIADGLRLKGLTIPGASSVEKQQGEFEKLLRSGPIDNPQYLKANMALEQAEEGMQQAQKAGQQLPPEVAQQVAQLKQLLTTIPPMVSSVPVADDDSENHVVEADTCFDWLNGREGQKFKFGTEEQQASFKNVNLHRTEHAAKAKQIAAENAPPPAEKPVSESLSASVDKLPAGAAVQALAKMGIKATPQDFAEQAKDKVNAKVVEKSIPARESIETSKQPQQIAA